MDPRFTLLLADSHTPDRRRLAGRLSQDGYTVLQAATRGEAVHQLATGRPDGLIVADLETAATANALVAAIRAGDLAADLRHLPVIALSAEPRELALLQAFRAGVDDYVARWTAYPELRARIGALLTRAHARDPAPAVRTVGALVVDLDAHAAAWNGRRVRLSDMEFALLAHLAGAPTNIHSKEALLRRVWGYSLPAKTRTVDAHIRKLRAKLAEIGADGLIVTRHGVGYQLVDPDSDKAAGASKAAQP